MGSVIAVSPWLHDLALRGRPYLEPARAIMRAQILVEKRRGHILEVDSEYIRRSIVQSARHGRVARVIVPCVRCRWQAWLTDWVRSVDLRRDEIEAILRDNTSERQVIMTAYLRTCYGNLLAAELAAAEHAPKVWGE